MKPRQSQRGLSLVELLIGAAIALFIAAVSATLLASNLRENRSLLLEARLMQDLRTAADLVTRDLRRAGYWGGAVDGVWSDGGSAIAANPYIAVAPGRTASETVTFRYSRDTTENNLVDGNEQFGFRLHNGAIEIQLGAGNWQALTDAGTLKVTAFVVTPTAQTLSLQGLCATPCPPGGVACPPQLQVRGFAVAITGQRVGDSAVTRSVRSQVRLRNDTLTGACV